MFTYRVREQRVVEPTDFWVAEPSDAPQLTLITCLYWDPQAHMFLKRLAVFADLVGVAPLPGQASNCQAELAARLGTVPDVIQRALRGLEAEGVIEVERHRIRIRDRSAVEAMATYYLLMSVLFASVAVLAAPLIILKVPGFPGAGIEQNAPQALVCGWVLQFGYALLPYLLSRAFQPERPARLGGNWFSLIAAQLGGALLWAGIFVKPYQAPLHGAAYVLWAAQMLPVVADLWRIARGGLDREELQDPTLLVEDHDAGT